MGLELLAPEPGVGRKTGEKLRRQRRGVERVPLMTRVREVNPQRRLWRTTGEQLSRKTAGEKLEKTLTA